MDLQEHYEKRRELDALEEYDTTRKHLIRLAVMRVVALAGTNPQTNAPVLDELINKCHNYELTINKLKQDWNTKEKLSESRIEKLKDDLAKARQQARDKGGFNQPSYMAPLNRTRSDIPSRTNLSFNTSPYLSRPGSRATDRNKDIFSPIAPRQPESRGKYITSGTLRKNLQNTPRSSLSAKLQLDRAMTNKMSPTKSPSRLSFIENFDKSDPSKSPSPEFTPSKVPQRILAPSETLGTPSGKGDNILPDSLSKEEPEAPDANSTAIDLEPITETSDSDVFASANSSVANASIISKGSQERAKGKAKVLNLAGSLKGNERVVSRGLNIEQDGVNSLDYYKDTNFTEGNEESPNFKRHQPEQRSFERKKKKVFKIA